MYKVTEYYRDRNFNLSVPRNYIVDTYDEALKIAQSNGRTEGYKGYDISISQFWTPEFQPNPAASIVDNQPTEIQLVAEIVPIS